MSQAVRDATGGRTVPAAPACTSARQPPTVRPAIPRRPHDGTVLFVLFRAVGLFRPQCERDDYMIRTAPSYRSGRHFGAFLCLQVGAGRGQGGAAC